MNTFDYLGKNLRSLILDGEPWFVAADVCRCVGISLAGGAGSAVRKLDSADKRTVQRADVSKYPMLDVALFRRREPQLVIVSESGLYTLVMRADGASAKPFQNWVTREVLPAIRKTGGYLLNEDARQTAHADTKEAMPLPPEMLALFQQMTAMMTEQAKATAAAHVTLQEQVSL